MTSTRNNSDSLLTHVVSVILDDKIPIRACLSSLGFTTYRELIGLMKDHNKVNSLKWRNGSNDEDLPDHIKEQLKLPIQAKIHEMIIIYQDLSPTPWEQSWGAIILNWIYLWGALTSHLLSSWVVSNSVHLWGAHTLHSLPSWMVSIVFKFLFVRCRVTVHYFLLVLRTIMYSCLDRWEMSHLSSARRMSNFIFRRFFRLLFQDLL